LEEFFIENNPIDKSNILTEYIVITPQNQSDDFVHSRVGIKKERKESGQTQMGAAMLAFSR
jgi:hypothetical protein